MQLSLAAARTTTKSLKDDALAAIVDLVRNVTDAQEIYLIHLKNLFNGFNNFTDDTLTPVLEDVEKASNNSLEIVQDTKNNAISVGIDVVNCTKNLEGALQNASRQTRKDAVRCYQEYVYLAMDTMQIGRKQIIDLNSIMIPVKAKFFACQKREDVDKCYAELIETIETFKSQTDSKMQAVLDHADQEMQRLCTPHVLQCTQDHRESALASIAEAEKKIVECIEGLTKEH